MQVTDVLDYIFGLFSDPLIMIATLWIIGVVIAMVLRRKPKVPKDSTETKKQKKSKDPKVSTETKKQKKPKGKVKGHLIKQMQKMESEAGKDKKLTVPSVRSRQEIITEMFESKTRAIGLVASTSSGYIPVSNTPLARFLKDKNVPEDTVSAIIDGIMEEESDSDVRAIIEAASPELGLAGNELENAKDLAVEEWRNVRKTSGT